MNRSARKNALNYTRRWTIPGYFIYYQKQGYVNVYMKWKKDNFYDSIDVINKTGKLQSILAFKNRIASNPSGCIPLSDVSKRGKKMGIYGKVASFLRLYPSVFQEYVGSYYNHPWFRLTPEAAEIHREEFLVYKNHKSDILNRLRRFILMSVKKQLPLHIIRGFVWNLGIPNEFLQEHSAHLHGYFLWVEMEDGLPGLAVVDREERIMSAVQINGIRRGVYSGGSGEPVRFPLFPSKGTRLRSKISDWLMEFQNLPYISPYEDFSHLDRSTDFAEKRVVAFVHELFSLFVDGSAQRSKLLCLKKYFGLPQKFQRVFDRHTQMFYLSLNNGPYTIIFKEAYQVERLYQHPLFEVRCKYVKLMNKSEALLKSRIINNRSRSTINSTEPENVENAGIATL